METWKRCAVLLILVAAVAHASRGHQSDQGTTLHGTEGNYYERVIIHLSSATPPAALGSAFSQLTLHRGQLMGWVTTPSGPMEVKGWELIGTTFSVVLGSETILLTLESAGPHINVYTGAESRETWQYTVSWRRQGSPVAYELCPGRGAALAVPGQWLGGSDTGLLYHPNLSFQGDTSLSFSFACLPRRTREGHLVGGGVSAKCVDWGYAPWSSRDVPPGEAEPRRWTDEEARRFHVACVSMASADYCGEGRPNTLQGTPILMFHTQDVNTMPDPDDDTRDVVASGPLGSTGDFYFEAAWGVGERDGTLRANALCMTKKRWSTLPVGGSCSTANWLLDPRTRRTARYCEEYTARELLDQGALLFSYSKYLDAGLYRFRHHTTGEQITTTQVSINPSPLAQAGEPYRLNLPGIDPSHYGLVGFEGIVISPTAPAQLLSNLGQMVTLNRYKSEKGMYVTLTEKDEPPSPDYELEGREGYVTFTSPPGTNPAVLRLWSDKSDSYVTTTHSIQGQLLNDHMGFLPSLAEYAAGQQ